MAAYQVKVKYGEERFCTFLIKVITSAKPMQAIKRNCSPLAHLPPASNIRVRYRDEDGDTINFWENSSGFSFGEMLRSAKEVNWTRFNAPPNKMRRTDLGIPSSEADNEWLQPKQLSFTPEAAHPAATTGNYAEKKFLGLPATGNWRKCTDFESTSC